MMALIEKHDITSGVDSQLGETVRYNSPICYIVGEEIAFDLFLIAWKIKGIKPRELGITNAYANMILHGKRKVSEPLLKKILEKLSAKDLLEYLVSITGGGPVAQLEERRPRTAERILELLYQVRTRYNQSKAGLPVISVFEDRLILFEKWLLKKQRISPGRARDYVNALRKIRVIDAEKALEVIGKDNWLKASRKFIHFLYEVGEISKDDKERWLSLLRRRNPKTYSKRAEIDWVETITTIREILEKEKQEHRVVLLILYYSGARVDEAVMLYNEYDPSRWHQVAGNYGRYWLGWSRGSKRCDWIYIPNTVKNMLETMERHRINYNTFRTWYIHNYGFPLSRTRKLFYQICKLINDKEICNFYESRIGKMDTSDLKYDNLKKQADNKYHALLSILQQALINPEILRKLTKKIEEKRVEWLRKEILG